MTPFEFGILTLGILSTLGLWFVGFHLSRLSRTQAKIAAVNDTHRAMLLISLEESLMTARVRLSDAVHRVIEIRPDGPKAELNAAILKKQEAQEQYLNICDRLCACILHGLIDNDTCRREYHAWVGEAVKIFKQDLGPDSAYPNIWAVHQAWSNAA